MIDRILAFSVRRRGMVLLAALVLALAGAWAAWTTPVDAIPDLSENQVLVFCDWPGHGPREIEDQVTYPLALELQGLSGVRVVRSSSEVGFSLINVIFEDGIGLTAARDAVEKRLARAPAALPTGVVPRLGPDAAATGQLYWYTVEGPGYDLGRLRAVQDWYVRPQLGAVPGVAEVASVGGHVPQYAVEIDPLRLAALGVSVSEIASAIASANAAAGGNVLHAGNAELVVRGAGWLGMPPGAAVGDFDPKQAVRDLENVLVPRRDGGNVRLAEMAKVSLAPRPRRGALEKDGSEVVGGVVLLRQGDSPLEVTARVRDKVAALTPGLPPGVRIVPFYDRTPLIQGAVGTVTGTLLEAALTAAVCVLLVLRHWRTSFVIILTLPLSVLGSFLILAVLRRLGLADVQINIMSLAGIAVSVGVLVDSSVVTAENVLHRLHQVFGDRPIRGDVREVVLEACRTVGRPLFFATLILLLSFAPVFAMGGLEGKMFRPMAWTKSLALVSVAVLALTVVPALCTVFVRGRVRGEMSSWLVRGVVSAYRPALNYSLSHPLPLVWIVGATFVLGSLPSGIRWLFLVVLLAALVGVAAAARGWRTALWGMGTMVLLALWADRAVKPLGSDLLTPLDEGMVMDMPITVPRASVTQSVDDLKARDMVLCRFPEVEMVVGKAGRAETPTDPAPLDMIETMVSFRPAELWPRRALRGDDARRQARVALDALCSAGLTARPEAPQALVEDATMAALERFDALMRDFACSRNQDLEHDLGPLLLRAGRKRTARLLLDNGSLARMPSDVELASMPIPGPTGWALGLARDHTPEDAALVARDTVECLEKRDLLHPGADPFRIDTPLTALAGLVGSRVPTLMDKVHAAIEAEHLAQWRQHVRRLDGELRERAAMTYTRVVLEELLGRLGLLDRDLRRVLADRERLRSGTMPAQEAGGHHHHGSAPPPPTFDPHPALDRIEESLSRQFALGLMLWPRDRAELTEDGGELDRSVRMPGWTNVWTRPIQNRIDMLTTGVNTQIGVRVLGRRLADVEKVSQEVARALVGVPGAPPNLSADPIRGKGYLDIQPDRERAARLGVRIGDVLDVVEIALGEKVVTQTVEGRERRPVCVRLPREWRRDAEVIARLPVPVHGALAGEPHSVPLSTVATVHVTEGPAAIRGENGLLRNYVRLNVRGRDAADFVDEARRVVAARVPLPAGTFIEWTGQFEHAEQARRSLTWILPTVLVLIFLLLYVTYHDLADALVMLFVVVPGALFGGMIFQWLFGTNFQPAVWVGYIACFGMAAATGIIMLVYLRETLERRGGLAAMSLAELRQAVLDGAAQRLRPKLLTECTMVLGLAPLLWAQGVGAEVLRPMVLPVLGGILVADEVIDLLLPVLFFHVRRWRWQRLHGRLGGCLPCTSLN